MYCLPAAEEKSAKGTMFVRTAITVAAAAAAVAPPPPATTVAAVRG